MTPTSCQASLGYHGHKIGGLVETFSWQFDQWYNVSVTDPMPK
ncbi:hypothetical protein Nizo2259_1747 [Lactiplantibacillus plantarum]|uniref:Uncharacterized protein n=1 Tax=Lactiplantibacillus plantarum TaxID=1590 RepID=A0A165B065_LACPN|nr:hypothetical protein [Lactiplantibacillus plantarum]AGE40056.1 Hypothetical protein zj316_2517 [Lactiplantibacillus plantarum ZJ316]AGL64887.2 hypothetical protein LBP_cg2141 [Lactiplantibacillus plantarum subsp. plantarum P-8]AHN69801.1 hypothetical protein I526_2115 [Lactiplantibacillus plantarum DOMLa]EFK29678.1 hypothetical protein HMPREF0531_11303 [Lactiplantibacillus plantarum subsp. plantarum ATCC 14917 = JCM 1149 = CGMCC 1.2437]ETF11817.1 hypothetical protein N654_1757 [Lactiplantib